MNWLYRIFNWRKSPKATNEMKPVDMSKYYVGRDPICISNKEREYSSKFYWKVKKSWKRSPKNYSLYYNTDNPFQFRLVKTDSICRNSFQSKNNVVVGNLYTLYHQYYGKENKSKS